MVLKLYIVFICGLCSSSVPKAYKAPHFIEELVALLTEQGTVSLECKVVGVPTPTLKWFKVSVMLDSQKKLCVKFFAVNLPSITPNVTT